MRMLSSSWSSSGHFFGLALLIRLRMIDLFCSLLTPLFQKSRRGKRNAPLVFLWSILVSIVSACFKCSHHPTVAGSRVLANRTLTVLLYFVRTRLFSKSAVKLAITSGMLFGTNASHLCWRLKIAVLVIIMVFFLIRHRVGNTRG